MNDLAAEYDRDFDAWIQRHITLLKQGHLQEMDVEHLIIELEDMGKSNLMELENRLIILIAHLLKWQFQLEQLAERWQNFESRSWRSTLIEQRFKLGKLLKANPNLKSRVQNVFVAIYPEAVELAVKETQLSPSVFPSECPYTLEQVLDADFYPEEM